MILRRHKSRNLHHSVVQYLKYCGKEGLVSRQFILFFFALLMFQLLLGIFVSWTLLSISTMEVVKMI